MADIGRKTQRPRFIGIGASAGGLHALQEFLRVVPRENRLAIIIVTHLDPNSKTMLPEILSKVTAIPVSEPIDCEQRRIALRIEQVELSNVIQCAVEASQPLIDELRHELVVQLPQEPLRLAADPIRLAQVISNLLNNAAKYSESAGRIWLTATVEKQEIVIVVKDTGIGLNQAKLTHVFEMFSQIENTREKRHGGLGIGLSLSKGLVEMHGGSISAFSEGLGRGCEFVVRLPIGAQESAPVSSSGGNDTSAIPPSKHRILVADDNCDAATSMAMMLSVMGHDVSTANDGAEAVESAGVFQPDLILMDIGMPKMDGYEAARRICATMTARRPMLVALTGWGAADDRDNSRAAGFDHHLTKPVAMHELQRILAQIAGTVAAASSTNCGA